MQIQKGKYYKIAESFMGLKKGKIYRLIDSNYRAYDNDPCCDGVSFLTFKDVKTGKKIEVTNAPPSIIGCEVKPPESEREEVEKEIKEKRDEKKRTLILKLPKGWEETVSVSFVGVHGGGGSILLHYNSENRDEITAIYHIERSLCDLRKIMWE